MIVLVDVLVGVLYNIVFNKLQLLQPRRMRTNRVRILSVFYIRKRSFDLVVVVYAKKRGI